MTDFPIRRPQMRPHDVLRQALTVINQFDCGLGVVVDDGGRVIATVSDGDIRRGLLAGSTLDSPVSEVMHRDPITVSINQSEVLVLEALEKGGVSAVVMVDDLGRLMSVRHLRDYNHMTQGFGAAVIMAGGEGRRLRPLTETIPKPLVDVGGKPVIEHTVERLAAAGIAKVHVSVNYLADKIQAHLGDGSCWGTDVSYISEPAKLGTAGALSLLPEGTSGPLLVINGDVLTSIDFRQMLEYHVSAGAVLTVGVVEYHIKIPYGVVSMQGGRVSELLEKPEQRVPINAGVYVVESTLLSRIPGNTFYNMTDLINDCLASDDKVVPYLIHERWIDIGSPQDLERARQALAGAVRDKGNA